MHSDLLFSVVLCGKGTKVRGRIMNCKMGAAGLAGAFVAGMVVAVLGGGMAAMQGQQVTVQGVISPMVTDDRALTFMPTTIDAVALLRHPPLVLQLRMHSS